MDSKVFPISNFLQRSEVNDAYILYETMSSSKKNPSTIIGKMERFPNFPLSQSKTLLLRMKAIVHLFLINQNIKSVKENITLLTEQLIMTPAGNDGQRFHMDTWMQYPTIIIYLTAGKSTKFAKYDYWDVSLKNKTDEKSRYPYDWYGADEMYWNVGPGDLAIFWSNFPHRAPENSSKKDKRLIYYAAFTIERVTPLRARTLVDKHLECPVYQTDYVHIGNDKPTRKNRNISLIYLSIF